MVLLTYDGKLWYPTLYDLDTSFGTNWNGEELYDYHSILIENTVNLMFLKLKNNFGTEISKRYFELRKDILNEKNIVKMFEDFESSIPKETFKMENERWENIPGYDINQIKDFLKEHTPIIDDYMKSLDDSGNQDILEKNVFSRIVIYIMIVFALGTSILIYRKKFSN